MVRSGIARVPDLSIENLDQVIRGVRRQAQANSDACEEVDLSHYETLAKQMAWLEAQR